MGKLRTTLTRIVGWCGLFASAFFPLSVVVLIETIIPAAAQFAASTQAALSNTAVSIKGSPGAIQALACYNPNATVEYVQVYDTTGSVTVGTTPAKFSVPLTPSTVTNVQLGVNMYSGIKVAGTTTSGGGTAPASALPCSVVFR